MPQLILSKVDPSLLSELRNAKPSLQGYAVSKLTQADFRDAWLKNLEHCGAPSKILSDAGIVATQSPECIVTGQQLGVGISPILTIFKMFFTEVLANSLSDKNKIVYPIFWMQSEDHDLNEVLDFSYDVNEGTLVSAYSLFPNNILGQRSSVGYLESQKLLEPLWQKLEERFGGNDFTAILKAAYDVPGATLSSGFTKLYYGLFPDSNLVFFDINAAGLEQLKSSTMQLALEFQDQIQSKVQSVTTQLNNDGFDTPVKIKKNSPLFFYHPEGKSGPRYRLERITDGRYQIESSGQKIDKPLLEEQMLQHPEMFSSSALLRSFMQDQIFNTVAYVGGPAEISYLRQIKELYPIFKLNEPARVLRPSGIVIDDTSYKHFKEYKGSLFASYEELKESLFNEMISSYGSTEQLLDKIEKEHISKISELLDETIAIDGTLENPKNKTISHMREGLEKFLAKYKAAHVRKDEVMARRIEKVLQQIFLQKENSLSRYPQERVLSLSYFGLQYGLGFVRELRNQFFKSVQF